MTAVSSKPASASAYPTKSADTAPAKETDPVAATETVEAVEESGASGNANWAFVHAQQASVSSLDAADSAWSHGKDAYFSTYGSSALSLIDVESSADANCGGAAPGEPLRILLATETTMAQQGIWSSALSRMVADISCRAPYLACR